MAAGAGWTTRGKGLATAGVSACIITPLPSGDASPEQEYQAEQGYTRTRVPGVMRPYGPTGAVLQPQCYITGG